MLRSTSNDPRRHNTNGLSRESPLRNREVVHWEDPEGSGREGGVRGDRMGNTCKPTADSGQCMAKTTTIL